MALINASAEHDNLKVDMIQCNLVSTLMECLSDKDNEIRDVQIMLLANITTDAKAASQLLQEATPLEV